MYNFWAMVIPLVAIGVTIWVAITPPNQIRNYIQKVLFEMKRAVYWVIVLVAPGVLMYFVWMDDKEALIWSNGTTRIYLPHAIQATADWLTTVLCIIFVPLLVYLNRISKKGRIKKIQELRYNYY